MVITSSAHEDSPACTTKGGAPGKHIKPGEGSNKHLYLKQAMKTNMLLAAVVGIALISVAYPVELYTNVAFTAGFSKDTKIESNTLVIFPEVYTNHAEGYNSTTGVFTCPKGGLYMFHIHAASVSDRTIQLDLYRNDVYMISAHARQSGERATGGNSVAMRLYKNDRIVVKTGYLTRIYGRPNEIYATYTGYLVAILTASQ